MGWPAALGVADWFWGTFWVDYVDIPPLSLPFMSAVFGYFLEFSYPLFPVARCWTPMGGLWGVFHSGKQYMHWSGSFLFEV